METKIIKAVFGAVKSIITQPRYRYDYGQIIEVSGITLPESFEARFSNAPTGTSVRVLGSNQRVAVPDALMRTGKSVWCYITVHDAVTDGRTMYTIRIPIKDATERTDAEPTPVQRDIISQAIATLNSAVERTAQDVESADASAQSASDSADRAEAARDTAEGYVGTVQGYTQQAQTSATNASSSATASANSASQAQQIKTDVEGMVDEAQSAAGASAQSALESAQSASQASVSASSASQSADTASTKASEASASAQTASAKATEASEYASTASQKASESSQSASAASGYATQAGQAKTAAETAQGLAETARNEAVSAKTDAESARDEAQEIVDGITGKVEQIDSNTDRIESLEDDRYKPYPTDSVSGSIASFPDGADNIPIKSCIVRVEPVQDLHGYDSPWPAGGGKNLWSNDKAFMYTGKKTFTFESPIMKANEMYTISGTLDIDDDRYTSLVMFYGPPSGSYTANVDITEGTFASTFSPKVDVYRLNFYATRSGATNQGVTASFDFFQLESGSTATSYAPYENICPISGWTGCEVRHSGEDTSNPTTYPITFPTEAGTVYGGYVDVTGGELVVDRAYAELTKDSNWEWNNNNSLAICSIPRAVIVNENNQREILVQNNLFTNSAWVGRNNLEYACGLFFGASYVFVRSTNHIASLDDFKTIIGDNTLQVVYTLASPITYQLTPQEITSLLGTNNVWSNTGDTAVEYRADVTLYIGRLTEPDADMIADSNITSGSYFMVGNNLYRATVNIASGASVIVGTNAVKISLAQALNEINA